MNAKENSAQFGGRSSSRFVILLSLSAVLSLLFGGLVAMPANAVDYQPLPQHIVDAITKAGGKCEAGVCEPAPGQTSVTLDGKVIGVDLLHSADFRGWEVKGFNLLNLDLSYSKWSDLEQVSWDGISGGSVNLPGSKLIDFHISNSELHDSSFYGARGTGVALSSVKLKDCDLSMAQLDGTRTGSKSNYEWANVSLLDGTEVYGLKITNVTTNGIEVGDIKYDEQQHLTISNSSLQGKDVLALAKAGVKEFPANTIQGTLGSQEKVEVLENLNFSGSSFSAFHWRNLVLKDCNLDAINTNANRLASITNVKINNGSIDHANLSNVDAKQFEIHMDSGQPVNGFVMINASVDRGVIDGEFTNTSFLKTEWIKSDLENLRGDPATQLEPGEFHIYLNDGLAHGSTAPKVSKSFDYNGFVWAEGSKIADNALMVDSRLNNMVIDGSTKVGPEFEIRNCQAIGLQANGVEFDKLKVVDSDLLKSNFDASTFNGNTKFDNSVVEDVTFKDVTLKGERFTFTGWVRKLLIKWGWISPATTVSFRGAAIDGEIDFSGSRAVGENHISWRGAIAEPGSKVILANRADAELNLAAIERAGVMAQMQVEYKSGDGTQVLHQATDTTGLTADRQLQLKERDLLNKATANFYASAELERQREQDRLRKEIRERYPKPIVK